MTVCFIWHLCSTLYLPYFLRFGLGNSITMLSSTSLLHGNCIFNRNNTVATQQGMKTYWLCKSYRLSMCRARCITHQGRVISATGVHNHVPHMVKNPLASGGADESGELTPIPQPIVIGTSATTTGNTNQTIRIVSQDLAVPSSSTSQTSHIVVPSSQSQAAQYHSATSIGQQMSHHLMGPQTLTATPFQQQPTAVIQNMMQNVLTSNNLMHQHHLATSFHGLTNIGPILNPLQPQQHHVLTNIHAPPSLQITPVVNAHHIQTSSSHTPQSASGSGHHIRATLLPSQQSLTQLESPNMASHQQHSTTISSTPSTVLVQSNSSMSQSQSGNATNHSTEEGEQLQQENSSHQASHQPNQQQQQGSNNSGGGIMQTIEMNSQTQEQQPQLHHDQQGFKIEHL